MTRWGSRSSGSPTTSTSGRSPTTARGSGRRARAPATFSASRSATTAWRAAAAARIAGTFSKPGPCSSPARPRGTGRATARPAYDEDPDAGAARPTCGRTRPAAVQPSGKGEPAGRGARVDEQGDVARGRLRDLGDRLHRADLVVGRLAGDDRGVGEAGRGRRGGSGPGRPRRRHASSRPDHASGVEHGGVLDRGVHDPVDRRGAPRCRPSSPRCTASVPEAVNVTSSGRTPSASARRRARVVEQQVGRTPARVVDPPGVGVRRGRGRPRTPARCRVQRLSGRGVQVDPIGSVLAGPRAHT